MGAAVAATSSILMQLRVRFTVLGDRESQSFGTQLQCQLLGSDGVEVVMLEELARCRTAFPGLYAVVDKIGKLTVGHSVESTRMDALQEGNW